MFDIWFACWNLVSPGNLCRLVLWWELGKVLVELWDRVTEPETQNNYLLSGWLNCVSSSSWFSLWQAVLISEEIKMADTSWKKSSSRFCFVCIITEIFCLIRWIRAELRLIARILRKAVHYETLGVYRIFVLVTCAIIIGLFTIIVTLLGLIERRWIFWNRPNSAPVVGRYRPSPTKRKSRSSLMRTTQKWPSSKCCSRTAEGGYPYPTLR